MSTNNKLFEKMLNYLFNIELFLKNATIYYKQLTLWHFGGKGFLKKMKDIYYEDRKENIPVTDW